MTIGRGRPLPDADEQAARETTIAQAESDPERFLSEYTKRFGNVLNADNAATLFEEYNRHPAKYRVAVHPAAQWIRDELFRRALGQRAEAGSNRVVFMAGGNASGKSAAVAASGARSGAQIVLDSTFSNTEHATRLVNDALEAGKAVTVNYVARPPGEALLGMIDRARSDGRVVTVDQLIGSQRGAAETVRKLWDRYREDPRVTFHFLDNGADRTIEGGIEIAIPQNYTESRQLLDDLLDREFAGNRISEATYRRIRGPDAEPGKPPEGGYRGGPGGGGTEPPSAAETPAEKPRSGSGSVTLCSRLGAFEPFLRES